MTVLEVQDVIKSYSGIRALDGVSLQVSDGERVGLIGPNGAGKTTLFDCILGAIEPDRGAVALAGRDLTRVAVHRRARLGMGRTFQRVGLFVEMTVREHLLVGHRHGTGSLRRDLLGRGRPSADELARCDEILELLGIEALADEPVEMLSLGQARLVEVGRALATEPTLLLLDEPSSGLDRRETDALAETLRTVQQQEGFAILLVEHDIELVGSFTERCYVLDFGRMIASGPTPEVLADPVVRRAYLGDVDDGSATAATEPQAEERKPRPRAGERRSRRSARDELLRDVHARYGPFRALFGVSVRVEPGAAVALVGANGAGKTTVARVATGLVAPMEGTVQVGGHDLTGSRTHRFARAGVFHAPEGRSVFASLTVEENLRLARRDRQERAAAVERAYELFPRLGDRSSQLAGTLSGGEQRMLALAAVMVDEPAVLVADELSLGLAPVVVDNVYERLAEIRAAGTAMLIVEQQVQHALELCDEVVVLRRGVVEWTGPTSDAGDALAGLMEPAGPAVLGC